MKIEYGSSSVRVWISVSFLVLAVVLELTMVRYWSGILEPRLHAQAKTNAQLMAQSQAVAIADVLSRNDLNDASAIAQVQAIFDQLLLVKDPVLDRHIFVAIALEVDYDVVSLSPGLLDVSQGEASCDSCFEAPVELYSRETEELLGVVTFLVSDIFFQNIRDELKERFIVEGIISLALLFLLWLIVINLVRNLNRQIEQRKKTQEALIVAKEQAEFANEARGQFLANMSHEIRTPMNAIIGLCHVVLKTKLSTFQRNNLTKVHSSARSLLTLINDILDFSKIESGKFDIESIEFDMDEVLENLSQMILPKTSDKELDILYQVEPEVPYQLIGDPFRLGQILLNLINNAIKFTHEGEIVVSITVAEPAQNNKVTLLFSVSDTGIGIAEDARDSLFSSFTQADSSMSRKYGGTGLGLAICKSLVDMMDGDIWVRSELDKGSTFYFTAVFGLESPEQFNRFIIPEEISRIHVLIVDDSETSRLIYSRMMASFNFEVMTAPDAEHAIELVELHQDSKPFELILMDWKMPGVDGIEAARMIKCNKLLKHQPSIILVSAQAQEDAYIEAQDYIDAYLLKPVCQSTLYDCIVGIFCQVPRKSYHQFTAESVRSNVASQFRGLKVLLVEDNKTNREVAVNLLEEVQLSVDCAVNGQQAIEAIQAETYDLVLMDVQMPLMDGITATKIMRDELGITIPIVAMTAHAMQGDKEKCLSAGMNDYLTKPIDIEHFYHTLEKWMPQQSLSALKSREQADVKQDKGSQSSVLSLIEGIDYGAALTRLVGNESLLKKLVAQFAKQNREKIKLLRGLVDARQWQQAKSLVHGIKGEAGNISANEVFEAAVALEHALESEKDTVAQLFEVFVSKVDVVFASSDKLAIELMSDTHKKVSEANDLIQDIHTLAQTSLHTTYSTEEQGVAQTSSQNLKLREQLEQILRLLKQNNLRASAQIDELISHSKEAHFEGEYARLSEYMNALDFNAATHVIEALLQKLEAKHTG